MRTCCTAQGIPLRCTVETNNIVKQLYPNKKQQQRQQQQKQDHAFLIHAFTYPIPR